METMVLSITGRSFGVQPAGITRPTSEVIMRVVYFILFSVILTACGGGPSPRWVPVCQVPSGLEQEVLLSFDTVLNEGVKGRSLDQFVQQVRDLFEEKNPGWHLRRMTHDEIYHVMGYQNKCSSYFILSYQDSQEWGVDICTTGPPHHIKTFAWPPPPRPY